MYRVHIIVLNFVKNIDCGYSLEPPRRGGSNEYRQSMFWAEIWKKKKKKKKQTKKNNNKKTNKKKKKKKKKNNKKKKQKKTTEFFIWKPSVFGGEIFNIFE